MTSNFHSRKHVPLKIRPEPAPDFEGIYVERWPDGAIKYQGAFQKGCKRIGQHVAFTATGFVMELSYWVEDELRGILLQFYEDGEREAESIYGETGSLTGNYVRRTFMDEKVYEVKRYEEFCWAEELDGTTSSKINQEIGVDAILERARRDLEAENQRIAEKFGQK